MRHHYFINPLAAVAGLMAFPTLDHGAQANRPSQCLQSSNRSPVRERVALAIVAHIPIATSGRSVDCPIHRGTGNARPPVEASKPNVSGPRSRRKEMTSVTRQPRPVARLRGARRKRFTRSASPTPRPARCRYGASAPARRASAAARRSVAPAVASQPDVRRRPAGSSSAAS